MNQLKRASSSIPAILLASFVALGLGGCAGMTGQEKGTAIGAATGAVVGNVLCGGLACTGIGAAVGGVVGNEVAKPKY